MLANVITALISAFAAALLTTWFSLWRFRQERWWEKKFQSYVAIMEALHEIGLLSDEELEASGTGTKLSDQRKKELSEKLSDGQNEINKQLYTGQFLLRDESVEALRSFLRDLDTAEAETDFITHHDRRSNAVHSCIVRMRLLAQQDLGSGTLRGLFRGLKFRHWT